MVVRSAAPGPVSELRRCEARSGRSVLIFSEEFDFQGPGVQNSPKLENRKIQDFGLPFLLPEIVKVQNLRFC